MYPYPTMTQVHIFPIISAVFSGCESYMCLHLTEKPGLQEERQTH